MSARSPRSPWNPHRWKACRDSIGADGHEVWHRLINLSHYLAVLITDAEDTLLLLRSYLPSVPPFHIFPCKSCFRPKLHPKVWQSWVTPQKIHKPSFLGKDVSSSCFHFVSTCLQNQDSFRTWIFLPSKWYLPDCSKIRHSPVSHDWQRGHFGLCLSPGGISHDSTSELRTYPGYRRIPCKRTTSSHLIASWIIYLQTMQEEIAFWSFTLVERMLPHVCIFSMPSASTCIRHPPLSLGLECTVVLLLNSLLHQSDQHYVIFRNCYIHF